MENKPYQQSKIEKIEIKPTKDGITNQVMEDLIFRANKGYYKYTTTLSENSKDDFLIHLYEELLDAAQYCKKELSFTKEIQSIINNTPNDQDLGRIIREKYGS